MAQNQTSICGLGRISPSPKIKFGFTCQPRNPNTEASRSFSSFAQSPDGEAWQVALLCISVTVFLPGRLSMANYRIGRKRRGVMWSNNVTEGNQPTAQRIHRSEYGGWHGLGTAHRGRAPQ